jgi:hypothetical protein
MLNHIYPDSAPTQTVGIVLAAIQIFKSKDSFRPFTIKTHIKIFTIVYCPSQGVRFPAVMLLVINIAD